MARWVLLPGLGGGQAWVLARRHLWECASCGRQTSVTAGTVLHSTRTPLTLWFWAAYLMSTHTPGISAAQLQRQLGISRYETAWLILARLRRAMVAPERAPLAGEIEVDEAFIGGRKSARRGGRDRTGKVLTAVAAEIRGPGTGRIRLQVLPDASSKSLQAFLAGAATPGLIVHTGGWHGYQGLPAAGHDHRPINQRWRLPDRQEILPRAHRTISNLRTWLEGTYHGTSPRHLQTYLDEFTFRHNRRRTPMAAFQTLLGLSALHPRATYRQITA